jgi:hypothetical protein
MFNSTHEGNFISSIKVVSLKKKKILRSLSENTRSYWPEYLFEIPLVLSVHHKLEVLFRICVKQSLTKIT